MTLKRSMCHAWGNPTLTLRSAGLIACTGFSASLDGCAPGQGSWSGFSLSQGPEERDRPGSTRHQSHRPSHRAFNVQPYSVGAPPLAHDERDERDRPSSLPPRSGFVRQPVRTSCGVLRSRLSCDTSSLSAPALPLLPVAPDLRWLSRQLNQRQPPPEPRPPEGRRDRGRLRSAWRYPFPKRQGPRPKITLDPAPQKSSWTARQREEGPDSRYRWTIPQACSIVSLAAPLSAGHRGKCVHGYSRAHYSAQVSDRCDSGHKIKHIHFKKRATSFSAYHKHPALMQPICTAVSNPCHTGQRPGRPSPVCQRG